MTVENSKRQRTDKSARRHKPSEDSVPIHPDLGTQKKRLNRIKGQVEGIERMIYEQRYYVDIIH